LTVLLAGHDTIANALVWTWILLAEHPEVEARVEREVDEVLGARPATAGDVPALAFTRQVLPNRSACGRRRGSWRGRRSSITNSAASRFPRAPLSSSASI
jgi:hypothetical protein